uniref:Uncharacterized protein n=1 Tax=Glossina palpalis gambiensis TaxID=67801 RepID=A0A1B0BNP0_9MUSC
MQEEHNLRVPCEPSTNALRKKLRKPQDVNEDVFLLALPKAIVPCNLSHIAFETTVMSAQHSSYSYLPRTLFSFDIIGLEYFANPSSLTDSLQMHYLLPIIFHWLINTDKSFFICSTCRLIAYSNVKKKIDDTPVPNNYHSQNCPSPHVPSASTEKISVNEVEVNEMFTIMEGEASERQNNYENKTKEKNLITHKTKSKENKASRFIYFNAPASLTTSRQQQPPPTPPLALHTIHC